ncbi:hypothetical protein [Pseudoalteromonas rubra]|uniref:hypothetical protein n=1 Tax=Pseudoalteromonas rubra TaxID=43658 RepID=UPI000F78E544|nr:hypothetical protein [Pseudoalteromonas rubra]
MFDFSNSRKTPRPPETPTEEVTAVDSEEGEVTVTESEQTVNGKVVKTRHVSVSRGSGGPQPATPTPPVK